MRLFTSALWSRIALGLLAGRSTPPLRPSNLWGIPY